MLSYCLKCKKNTESKNQKFKRLVMAKKRLLFKCAMCNSKKNLKQNESSALLSKLRIRTPLS